MSCTHILLEAIQLHDACGTRIDLQLISSCCSAELCALEIGLVECEGLATRGFPSQTRLCQSAFSGLLGEVEVNVVKRLPEFVSHGHELVRVLAHRGRRHCAVEGKWEEEVEELTCWATRYGEMMMWCLRCSVCRGNSDCDLARTRLLVSNEATRRGFWQRVLAACSFGWRSRRGIERLSCVEAVQMVWGRQVGVDVCAIDIRGQRWM